MTSKIYISYSRRDKEKVTEIKKELETVTSATILMCDYDVEGLPEQYVLDAVHGINECDIFLFMLSEYSQISEKPLYTRTSKNCPTEYSKDARTFRMLSCPQDLK